MTLHRQVLPPREPDCQQQERAAARLAIVWLLVIAAIGALPLLWGAA